MTWTIRLLAWLLLIGSVILAWHSLAEASASLLGADTQGVPPPMLAIDPVSVWPSSTSPERWSTFIQDGMTLKTLLFGALLMLAFTALHLSHALQAGALRWILRASVALVCYQLAMLAQGQLAEMAGESLAWRAVVFLEGLFLATLIVLVARVFGASVAASAFSHVGDRIALGLLFFALGTWLVPAAYLFVLSALFMFIALGTLFGLIVFCVSRRPPGVSVLTLALVPVLVALALRLHEQITLQGPGAVSHMLMLIGVMLFGLSTMLMFISDWRRTMATSLAQANAEASRLEFECAQCHQALTQAKQKAEAAEKARRSFLSVINHEFRGPLASIAGLSGLLREDFAWSKDLHRSFASIESYAQCLLQILAEAIAYERGDSTRTPLANAPVALKGFVEEFARLGDWLAERNTGSFSMESEANIPDRVTLDEQRVRQILLALLLNAWQHANCKKVWMRVGIQSVDTSQSLQFTVYNDGKDFSEAQFTQMLQAYRVGMTSKGLGLGLALAVRLALEMDGCLRIVQHGAQSGIALMLPLLPAEADRAEPDSQSSSLQPQSLEGLAPGDRHGFDYIRLSAADADDLGLDRLGDMVATGRLSDIEEWLTQLRANKQLSEPALLYVGAVAAALQRLDLHRLKHLSRIVVSDLNSTGE